MERLRHREFASAVSRLAEVRSYHVSRGVQVPPESFDQLARSARIAFGRSELVTETVNPRDVLEQLRGIASSQRLANSQ